MWLHDNKEHVGKAEIKADKRWSVEVFESPNRVFLLSPEGYRTLIPNTFCSHSETVEKANATAEKRNSLLDSNKTAYFSVWVKKQHEVEQYRIRQFYPKDEDKARLFCLNLYENDPEMESLSLMRVIDGPSSKCNLLLTILRRFD